MNSSDWENTKLGDVCEFQKGYAFKSKDYQTTGRKIVKVSDLNNYSVNYDGCICIDETRFNEYARYSLEYDDVIITTVGSWPSNPNSVVGKVVKVQKEVEGALLNQNAVRVRGSDELIQKYIFYLLKNKDFADYIIGTAQGAANQASITQNDIKNYEFSIPEKEEQKSIAATLSCLDDKIELNNNINKKLEEMAQNIFKSWFVDFEHFKDVEFEDSELGRIPKGWKVIELGDVVEIINGYSYKGSELKESPDAMMTIKNFDRSGGLKIDGFKEIEISSRVKDRHYLNLFDVLVACTDLTQNAEIIGNPILVLTKSNYNNLIASMDLVKIIPKDPLISNFFLYAIMKDEKFKQFSLGYTSGTTVLHLNKKAISAYKLALPNEEHILKDFSEIIEPMFKVVSENINQNCTIINIRDILLPKLMSGEIRVPTKEVK
jgi:type I restriction enzyme S subunit